MNETTQKAQTGGARAAGSEAEPDVACLGANSRRRARDEQVRKRETKAVP